GSFGVDPGNDITLGSINGTANTYIFADSRNTLRIADFDGNTATPGVVKGYYVSLAGADGLSVGDLAASGAVDGIAIGLYSKSGSITAGAALSTNPVGDFAVNAQTESGALISMASAEAGLVRLSAQQGEIRVGTGSGSTFVGGAVTARTGGISLSGREGVIAGALTAASQVDVSAARGSVVVGAVIGNGPAALSGSPCDGLTVCIGAGFDGTDGSGRTVTTGAVTASAGSVLMAGRDGLTTGGAVLAVAGSVEIRSPAGTVDTTAGAVTAGSSTGAYDATLSGQSLNLGDVMARRDIDLSANGATGSLNTGVLTATRALKVASVAGFGIATTKIGGTPQSVLLSSADGGVCLGTLVGGVCTGQALSKNSSSVELVGRTGVTSGDLGAKSLRVTVSEGAAVSGVVTSAEGVDIAARDGVKTAGVTAQKGVSLVASSGTVDAGAVTARDGTVLLQGRTGVKAGAITQARTGGALQVPDIDLIADGGSIAVGAVSGTGSLRGRALDTLAIGAVSGVDAVQLTAGKALTASGAIASRGGVELRSDTAGVGVQDVTAGGAVTVTARDAVTAGDVVGATTTAGDVTLTSTDGALTV
ncbi:MAG: beta strand repeat-containing protein, partial [Gammaproteobacteria bacterium]